MKKIVAFKKRKTVIRVFSLFALVFLSLLFSSCLLFSLATMPDTMTRPDILPTDHEHDKDDGYIYGRFFKAHAMNWDTWATRVIIIRNLNNSDTYSFATEGTEEDTLQMIAVPPGDYRVESVEYINDQGFVDSTRTFEKEEYQQGYPITFEVKPNEAVYLGDFITSVEIMANVIEFGMYPPLNKFKQTTADFMEKYPFLKEADITFESHLEDFQPYYYNEDADDDTGKGSDII